MVSGLDCWLLLCVGGEGGGGGGGGGQPHKRLKQASAGTGVWVRCRWESNRHRERTLEILTFLENAMSAIDLMARPESEEGSGSEDGSGEDS